MKEKSNLKSYYKRYYNAHLVGIILDILILLFIGVGYLVIVVGGDPSSSYYQEDIDMWYTVYYYAIDFYSIRALLLFIGFIFGLSTYFRLKSEILQRVKNQNSLIPIIEIVLLPSLYVYLYVVTWILLLLKLIILNLFINPYKSLNRLIIKDITENEQLD